MTANQLRQVLRTYTTHWLCWVTVLLWLVLHVQLPSASEKALDYIVWMSLMANLTLGMGIGLMLKLQFANPRARLLPGFRVAHLVAAGAIVGAAIAIEAVLVLAGGGAVAQLPLLSLTLLAIVASAWIAYLMFSVGFLLLMPLVFAPILAPQLFAGLIQSLNDNPIVSAGMACAGLAALAALGVRLWTLSEEMPEYSHQIPAVWDFTSRAGNRNRRRLEALAIARSGTQGRSLDLQFRLVLRGNTATGPLRRLLFRQLAGGFSSLSVMTGVFAVVLILLWLQSWSQQPTDPGEVFFLSFFPVKLVLSMVGGLWLRRWPYLAAESLWPLGRRDFVRDLARSMACDMAPAAGAHCAIIIVWLKLCSPQGPLGELLPWLALTMAQYVVAYCLMFRLVSIRRLWVLVLGILAVSGLSSALVIAALFADERFWSPVNVALAIIGTALVVALLYRRAFRRWCHVDLD